MIGLSRLEVCILKLFPAAMFSLAVALILTKAYWTIHTEGDVTCWTPVEFTPSQMQYTNKICRTLDAMEIPATVPPAPQKVNRRKLDTQAPNAAAADAVVFLLSLALLLAVPVAAGDVMQRIANATQLPSHKDLTPLTTGVRLVTITANRIITLGIFIAAIVLVRRFGTSHASFRDVVASHDLMSTDLFTALRQKSTVPFHCDVRVRSLTEYVFIVQCTVEYGPHVQMAKHSIFLAWISTITAMIWLSVQSVNVLLLLIVPTSRKIQLTIPSDLPSEKKTPS